MKSRIAFLIYVALIVIWAVPEVFWKRVVRRNGDHNSFIGNHLIEKAILWKNRK